MFCVKCGNEIKDSDLFCPKCGEKVKTAGTTVKKNPAASGICCVKCGNKIKDGMLFCTKCGTKVENAAAASAEGTSEATKEKKNFDPHKAAALANGYVAAVKSDKKLLAVAGCVLALVLILIIVIVTGAMSRSGGSDEKVVSASQKGDFYFDRKLKVGEIVEFGEYEQDGNTANGKEPIKWRVVSAKNDRYLLISVNILDNQAWDDGSASGGAGALEHGSELLYDYSSIRKWLNDYFDEEAFGEKERKYIIPVSFRNGVITVDENNQYGRDLAFLLESDEVVQINRIYLGAMVSQRLLQNGTYGYGDYSDITDYSNTGWYFNWYVRDTDNYGKTPTAFYWTSDKRSSAKDFESISPSEKSGIRPAVYISSDACYKKSADEIDGNAVEKMSAHTGKYFGGYRDDIGVMNFLSVDFKQGFFDVDSEWALAQDEELSSYLFTNFMEDSFRGKYNMSDFDYSKEDGKECFTDESRGMKLIYDSQKDNWLWYMIIPAGTTGFPEEKTEQWLLYQILIPEKEYTELKEKAKEE